MIGREKEIKEISQLYESGKAEFVAVYGRRRVGKTFLVDESLKGKITFRHAGLSPVDKDNKKITEINGAPCKKTLQKIVFLIEAKHVNIGCDYGIHFYGPYSADPEPPEEEQPDIDWRERRGQECDSRRIGP